MKHMTPLFFSSYLSFPLEVAKELDSDGSPATRESSDMLPTGANSRVAGKGVRGKAPI